MKLETDAILIDACRAGDSEAWSELVRRYEPLVASIPRRLGLNESDRDDVFQDVFLSLYRSLDQLRDVEALPAWLITTATRASYAVGRRSKRHRAVSDDVDEVARQATASSETAWMAFAEERCIGLETESRVRQCLDELGGRCAELLRLLFADADGPDYQAISRTLDIPVGAIGPTRLRCFRKLRRRMESAGLLDDDGVIA